MELKKLWCYIDARRALKFAQERLEEFEGVIYTPSGARTNGMPLERCNSNTDRLAAIADEHTALTDARDEAKYNVMTAYRLLLEFESILTKSEKEVFFLRYIKGLTSSEIERTIFKCERTIRRTTNRIKEKFKKFKNVR